MKKLIYYLVLFLFLPVSLISQSCLPDGIIFTTQEEVDYFPANYPSCTEISGRVIINGDNITNLDSLYSIVSIGRRLMIYNCPNIVSLYGLHNLNDVDTLMVSYSEKLKTLSGLEGITELTYLSIGVMEALPNLNGLDNLAKINYSFRLTRNNNLTDISALSKLYALNNIYIGYNPRLKNLNGLQAVLYSDMGIEIGDNDSLTEASFNDLAFSRYVYLYRNPMLNHLDFPNLLEINGDLAIFNNDKLTSLGDFNKLEKAEYLYIKANNMLEDINALNTDLNITKYIEIKENEILKNIDGINGAKQAIFVRINDNPMLQTINGFENLTELEENIEIKNNEYLTEITAFPKIENIKASLIISKNKKISEINGFGNLEDIGLDLILDNCIELIKLPVFNHLKEIGRNLKANNNDQLLDFSGFDKLRTIGGDFEIKNHSSLLNFQGMNRLKFLGGNLRIENNVITSLSGLEGIEEIELSCYIRNNPNLVSLEGLNNLSTINWTFTLENCDEVTDFNGLGSLTNSMRTVFIINNDKLINFNGLGRLKEVTSLFYITNNSNLSNFEGLNSLSKLNELYINRNNNLQDLRGLESLIFVEDFTISDSPSIKNLNGIENLNEIEDKLRLSNNASLNSLDGLDNAELPQELLVYDNPSLEICNTDCICRFLNENPDAEVSFNNNSVGCNHVNEIMEACENSGVFEPIVFPDWSGMPKWNVVELSTALPNVAKTYTYSYETDTIFCGKRYSRTYLHDIDKSIYLRSTNKRAFYRLNKNCTEKEYVLYDFDLDIGDTIWLPWNQYYDVDIDTAAFVLSSIDTIQQFGVQRERFKMIYAQDNQLFEGSFNWIKGIGSETHPFYPFAKLNIDSLVDYSLLCFDSSGVQLFQNPWWNTCDTNYISIEKTQENDFIISPNPFTNKLKITASNKNIQMIKLYSITGKLIQETAIFDNKTVIFHVDPAIPQGVYLIKIFTDDKMVQKKILKI